MSKVTKVISVLMFSGLTALGATGGFQFNPITTNGPIGVTNFIRSVAAPLFTNRNVIYVDSGGDDSTAVKWRSDLPFKTLTAAKAVATAGDTVIVQPGTYLGTNLLVNGVNWYFHPRTVVTNANKQDIFSDGGVASTNIIAGYGEFILDGDWTSALGFRGRLLRMHGANGQITMEIQSAISTGGNLIEHVGGKLRLFVNDFLACGTNIVDGYIYPHAVVGGDYETPNSSDYRLTLKADKIYGAFSLVNSDADVGAIYSTFPARLINIYGGSTLRANSIDVAYSSSVYLYQDYLPEGYPTIEGAYIHSSTTNNSVPALTAEDFGSVIIKGCTINWDNIQNRSCPIRLAGWQPATVFTNTATGTAGFSTNSNTVIGFGSAFRSEVKVDDLLVPDTNRANAAVLGRVVSIESDTSLTLSANANRSVTNAFAMLRPVNIPNIIRDTVIFCKNASNSIAWAAGQNSGTNYTVGIINVSASADISDNITALYERVKVFGNPFIAIGTSTFPANAIPTSSGTNVWFGVYKGIPRFIATNHGSGYQEFTNGAWVPFTP